MARSLHVPVGYAFVNERDDRAGHVFISYVRENSRAVDRLQRILESAGVPVWRDTAKLWPGEDWRARIRDAITKDALVFIVCFSRESIARQRSYQNEELAVAIEQSRLRRPDDSWLIPVRLNDCSIPEVDIGGGRTLASIQRADLFGRRASQQSERLVGAVLRILGLHSGHVGSPVRGRQLGRARDIERGNQDAQPVENEASTADLMHEEQTSPIDPGSAIGDDPVTILGRRTEVYLVEGNGEAVLEPEYITISLRSSFINLPPIAAELRQQMVAMLQDSQAPIAGLVAPWNSPAMATLTGYRISRTAVHEHVVIHLDMNVSDYATFAGTVLSLDTEIEKVGLDGLPMQTTLRQEYFPTLAEVSRAVRKPVPFLANGVGVVLLAFTDDGKVILTRRRDSSRARPGQRDVSIVEGIHTTFDAPSSDRVDVYLTAIRACREELGVDVASNDVQLLGFGVDMKYYQWNFFGSVELRCTTDEAIELHAMNAKDRWEGQLEPVAADPAAVFKQLHIDSAWDTAFVTAYLAFCKRIGVAETRRAAAQVFRKN